MSTEIKFEIGKFYKRADGEKMECVEVDNQPDNYSVRVQEPGRPLSSYWTTRTGVCGPSRLYITGPWTPEDEIALCESQLAEADTKRSEAQAALDAARKAKAEELEAARKAKEQQRVPWEPKGGEWSVYSHGGLRAAESLEFWRRAGAEYPTREAAEAARDRIVFFQRMCALATELNPSGKVGGRFYVYFSSGKWRVDASTVMPHFTMFETLEAAEAACDIMNRDKWEARAQKNGVRGISLEVKG